MNKTYQSIIFTFFCMLFLAGCTIRHSYIPKVIPIDSEKLDALNSIEIDNKIAIINSQSSDEKFLLGKIGATDYYGSLRDVTESVVQYAKLELENRNVDVVLSKKSKLIKLRVTSAECARTRPFPFGFSVRAIIDLHVETDSGLTKKYRIKNVTPLTVPDAYNGAAEKSVIEIFSDEDILKYISKKK